MTDDKAAVVHQEYGHHLYTPHGTAAPVALVRCRHNTQTIFRVGFANGPRQCSRRAHVFFGGIGFCWQHAIRVSIATGLTADEPAENGADELTEVAEPDRA